MSDTGHRGEGVGPTALFHTGIVVPDLDTSRAELTAALGIRWRTVSERSIVMATPYGSSKILMRYCYSGDGPHHLELIEGVEGTVWDASSGARLHHIGYGATDIEAAVTHVSAAGIPWVGGYCPSPGGPPAFSYHQSVSSPLIELVADPVRLRVIGSQGG